MDPIAIPPVGSLSTIWLSMRTNGLVAMLLVGVFIFFLKKINQFFLFSIIIFL